MKLTKLEIAGYRSISSKVTLILDRAVTVFLGANDHGKTNLLEALTHLNDETVFDPERDLNWNHTADEEEYPSLSFEFELDDDDRRQILGIALQLREAEEAEAAASAPATATTVTEPTTGAVAGEPSASGDLGGATLTPAPLTIDDVPLVAECHKKGVKGALTYMRASALPRGSMREFISANKPRVELIRARDNVPDSTTLASLTSDEHEFMRGIFYYAGLRTTSSKLCLLRLTQR